MTQIKICGLMREQDADVINEVKPDFAGFVFAPSRRQISLETALRFRQIIDDTIPTVGVFVNAPLDEMLTVFRSGAIQYVQLHGNEPEDTVQALKDAGAKVFQVYKPDEPITPTAADYTMLDSGAGSGIPLDWKRVPQASHPFILAGGLTPENVAEAITTVRPDVVDVSSGVETNKQKDPEKKSEQSLLLLTTTKKKIIERTFPMTELNLELNKNTTGRYGEYGGQYIPETLMNQLDLMTKAYEHYKNDPEFKTELHDLLVDYANRPSLLYYAKRMTEDLGGAQIYLKREDLNHTGAHKINNVIGQALLAKHMGKTRLIAETGAGQHGVATATIAALFGMECEVFMGKEDTDRQKLNVYRMELLGAKVHPVTSGSMVLKDAINAALQEWATRVDDTFYVMGSATGPHPYPLMVRDFQSIISQESKSQLKEQTGKLPDMVVACVGGGSNAIGSFANYIDEPSVQLVGAEAAGKGVDTDLTAATVERGSEGIFHGMKSMFLQNKTGQINPVYSISAGLDYPGVGPEHAALAASGRAQYVGITDDEAVDAFEYIAKTEGIVAAIESCHAVAYVQKIAPKMRKDQIIVCTLSGRGDKDVASIAKYKGVNIDD